jgi:selenocysteine lyase/cysteine desulfurase
VPFSTPEEMIGSMVTVPLPGAFHGDADDARRLQEVLAQRGIEVPIAATPSGFTTRVSAQIYCDHDDIERLATAVLELA